MVEVAPDNTSPTTLKWDIPLGRPTPDPALLNNVDLGSPTTLGWNYPPGVPTPDPALLAGVPDVVTWGYPPGGEFVVVFVDYVSSVNKIFAHTF